MKPEICTKFLLRQVLKSFNTKDVETNQFYLEERLKQLAVAAQVYKNQSQNATIPSRVRARARDLEQNAYGLINGIKFGISFMLHSKEDLLLKEYGLTEAQLKKQVQSADEKKTEVLN